MAAFESGGAAVGLSILGKFGWLKVISLGAALVGAGLMAIFRPPKTRKEMFLQGAVALGTSFLFGGLLASVIDHYFDFIDLNTAEYLDVIQFQAAVHGLLGALSWGLFGGLATLRDKVSKDPIKVISDVKDLV